MSKQYPTDLVGQARDVLEAWLQIDGEMKLGDLSIEALSTNIEEATSIDGKITSYETQLTHLRNQRKASYKSIWDKLKRLRAGIKAIYGDDSSQYEMVGGTRMSERKSPTRPPASPIQ